MAQKNAFRAAIETFEEHIQEGAAVQEAGDQNFRLHIQCMLYVLISRADSAADDLKSYLLKKMNESEVGNVRMCVRIRDLGGEVTLERQIGYVAKDYGKRHFAVVYLKNITHDILRARGAAYAQVRGHNMFHGKTELKPYSLWSAVSRWEHGNLYPMNKIMNMYQVIRFMLLTDKYILSGNWIVPLSGRSSPRAADAWRRMLTKWRMLREIDIWDVVCVIARNDYTPGTEAHEVMCDRHTKFDDMSLDYAKRLSRRALQLLEPHLLDGVIVGNIDIDAIPEQLDMPLEHAEDVHESATEHSRDDATMTPDRDGASEDGGMEENGEEVV
jgi:hypothetical protein